MSDKTNSSKFSWDLNHIKILKPDMNENYDVSNESLENQNNIANMLLKKYGVGSNVKFVQSLENDDYAHYNLDTNTIEISSSKNKNPKQFLLSILHEINHALDAKKMGRERYKHDYIIKGEMVQQKGGDFRDDNPYEIKAEKWAVQQFKKMKEKINQEHVGDGYNHPGDGDYDSSIPSRVAARKHPKKYKKQILKFKDLLGKTRYGK
tara:strand:- start:393 stop:1013 length:621 start_codon:yes stop_codon:yes gene_type:complete